MEEDPSGGGCDEGQCRLLLGAASYPMSDGCW